MPVDIILQHFQNLSEKQVGDFLQLMELYKFWNDKINVVSRKDIDNLAERHILYSLSIAKIIVFNKPDRIIDVGTGGGFPGIPLAIIFPQAHFTLIDSIGKKIKVVTEIAKELKLNNIEAKQERSENIKQKYNYIVSRAVASLPDFIKMSGHLLKKNNIDKKSSGIIYLKGGDLKEELSKIKLNHAVHDISGFFKYPFFETKKIVHIFF